jgi:hypothetical protein
MRMEDGKISVLLELEIARMTQLAFEEISLCVQIVQLLLLTPLLQQRAPSRAD